MDIKKFMHHIPDSWYIRMMYYKQFGKMPNLKNPGTFNEKIQWLKLHDRKEKYVMMVDKIEAKKYVAARIGKKYIIPTLGIWDDIESIDFDKLPKQFVLKCNHDSHSVIVCKDKNSFDLVRAKAFLQKRKKINGFWFGREWPYKNVKPKILAEQYLEDCIDKGALTDYKIHCFNGIPKVIQVITDRFNENGMVNDHYDLEWNKLELSRGNHATSKKPIPRPAEMSEMLGLAQVLAAETIYLRTDFYIVNHHIYFGELTLYPASGFTPFVPDTWDRIWGEWIIIPMLLKNE